MSLFADYKFSVGARFRFGSFECQANECGDLEQIPIGAVEEPRHEPATTIRFGLPADWQARLKETSDAAGKKEASNSEGETEEEDLEDRPFADDRIVCMAGRGGRA